MAVTHVKMLGMVEHAFNPRAGEAETVGKLQLTGQTIYFSW